MTSAAVRCSAWLGDVGQLREKLKSVAPNNLDLIVSECVIRKFKTEIVPGMTMSGDANNIWIQGGEYGR